MQLNQISFAGHLGHDASDLRKKDKPANLVTFTLCHSEKDKTSGFDKQTWVTVKTFGNWCDTAATFRKGDNVFVQGRLEVRKWKDQNGNERQSVEIAAFNVGRFAKTEKGRFHDLPLNEPETAIVERKIAEDRAASMGIDTFDDIPF